MYVHMSTKIDAQKTIHTCILGNMEWIHVGNNGDNNKSAYSTNNLVTQIFKTKYLKQNRTLTSQQRDSHALYTLQPHVRNTYSTFQF